MRKTTRLELVILSFILTFVLSSRLVARVFGSPTKSIVTLDATNENHLIQNVISITFDLNKTPTTNIFTLTDAPVASDVNYCKDQTPIALTATGTDLKWYLSESGSDQITGAPIPKTTSQGTTLYWVSQTIADIESPRAKLAVNVFEKPSISITTSDPEICSENSSELIASGAVTYKWYRDGIEIGQNAILNVSPPTTSTYSVKGYNSNGCENSAEITVTVIPKSIGGSVSGSTNVCFGNNSGTLNLTGYLGGIKEWRSSTNGITWNSIANTSTTLSYSNLIATTEYQAVIQNSSLCDEITSSIAKISVDPLSIGGILNFEGTSLNSYLVCYDSATSFSTKLELTNQVGTVKYWEKSINGGVNWTNVGNSGNTTFNSYTNLSNTTLFRAIVESGTCGESTSKVAVVSIIPDAIKPTPVEADMDYVCLGQNIQLTSQSGYASGSYITSGYFDDANPEGWIINGNPSMNFPANGNNTRPNIWSGTNDHAFDTRDGSKDFDSKDKKFAVVSGRNFSTMETPIFNTYGLTSATLNFDEAFIIGPNTIMRIEISINGGSSYNTIVRDGAYGADTNGVSRTNNYPNFSGSNQSIDLSDYVGLDNLRIRFYFDGRNEPSDKISIWAIDGITLPSKPLNSDIIWKDENGSIIGNTENITVSPDHPGINTFNITSFIIQDNSGIACQSSGGNTSEISIYAFDSYTSTAQFDAITCGNSIVNINASIKGKYLGEITEFPEGDNSKAEWKVISGPEGGTFDNPKIPNTNFNTPTNGTYILRWEIEKDSNSPCAPTYTDITFTLQDCNTIDFDGTNDLIEFGDNFMPTGDFSFEAWIKPNENFGNEKRTIFSKSNISNTLNNGIQLYINNWYPTFEWNNIKIISPYKIDSERWYHLAVVGSESLVNLYIDGISVDTATININTPNDYNFLLGASSTSFSPFESENYFYGWMEEIRIWNVALEEEQLHMMMNQKIKNVGGTVTGEIIPLPIINGLSWNNLLGYYQLEEVIEGSTPSKTNTSISGRLINITTSQERTAPLPYISSNSTSWFTESTWLRPNVWDAPNSLGVNGEAINWNIAKISHNINSGGKDIVLLGLISESNKLTIADPNSNLDEDNPGQALTITNYLDLNGTIDLVGESQLIQSEGSILASTSAGYLERDQQGTASSYNYNYWSSPVVPQGPQNNSDYTISGIMMDGTNSAIPKNLDFGNGVTYADGAFSNPRKISTYWLYKFHGRADEYSDWEHIGPSGVLKPGEGYTMKGTSGNVEIETEQNYTFKGKPNNGDITLSIEEQQNFLIGNPYPSAIDADQFLLDNLSSSGGNNEVNVFNGALYFWDHFGGKTHTLREYVGGYATYNLLGGLKAISIDDRINTDTTDESTKTPGRYIPVGQGFFINTILDDELSKFASVSGGEIIFKNSQRVFVPELKGVSVFHSQTTSEKSANKEEDTREKIRISFKSPKGYQRQLLVGADPNTTNGFDLGYDAPMNEYNAEDMFWIIGYNEFVIQGVANFDPEQILPIGIVVEEKGEIVLQLDSVQNIDDKKNIYLKDKWNNVIHDLRKEKFTSTSEAGYFVDRFELVFFKENESNLDEDGEKDTIEIVPMEDPKIEVSEIIIRYAHLRNEIQILNPNEEIIDDFRLYKMDGGLLQSFGTLPNAKEMILPVKNYSSGVYIAKCFLKNKIISQKFIRIK